MLCHAMLCSVLCYALCYAMLRYVLLCNRHLYLYLIIFFSLLFSCSLISVSSISFISISFVLLVDQSHYSMPTFFTIPLYCFYINSVFFYHFLILVLYFFSHLYLCMFLFLLLIFFLSMSFCPSLLPASSHVVLSLHPHLDGQSKHVLQVKVRLENGPMQRVKAISSLSIWWTPPVSCDEVLFPAENTRYDVVEKKQPWHTATDRRARDFICVIISSWCDVMWCDVMWRDVMSCVVTWCHVMSCDVMWRDVTWCDEMWRDVMSCDEMWCDVTWCDVMSCHVMRCDVMSCDVMSCHVM